MSRLWSLVAAFFGRITGTLAAIGVGLIVFSIMSVRIDHEKARADKAEAANLIAVAKLHGAVVGKRTSEKQVEKSLSPALREFVKAVKKDVPRAKVDSAISTTVTVKDEAKGTATVKPGQAECVDEYHRFHVVIPSTGECAVFRNQLFQLDTVFIRSPDGQTRIAQSAFTEFDPETRAVIPGTGVNLAANYTFMDEIPEAPPMLHPRLVVGTDHRLAIGAGVELLNLERLRPSFARKLTLSLIGYYESKARAGRAVAEVGYRLFNSNVTVGPYVGLTTKGEVVYGAGAVIQVTR